MPKEMDCNKKKFKNLLLRAMRIKNKPENQVMIVVFPLNNK